MKESIKNKIQLQGRDFFREKVRIRDNYTCQKCKKIWESGQRRFDVHHKNPKHEGDRKYSYNIKGLITLCHKCHLNLHTVKNKMRNSSNKRSSKIEALKKLYEIKWFIKMDFNQRQIAKIIKITPQGVNRYIKKLSTVYH